MFQKRGPHFYVVFALLIIYLLNGFMAIPRNSVTYDEMDHWSYGKRILKRQPQKIYPFDDASAMPVSGLNAIPRAVEQVFNPALRKKDAGFSDIMHGRYVTVLVCLLIGLCIYQWSSELFGPKAGIGSLFLFVFCPNLNAHASLLTTDAYAALFTLITLYFFWKFVTASGWKYFILFSFSIALAQLAKQSLLHLFILLGVVSLIILVKRKTLISHFKINLLRLVVLKIIVLLVINTGFFFQGTGHSLSRYTFHSSSFTTLQSSFVSGVPLPLPVPFVEGLDMTLYMNELGAGNPNVSNRNYLLGELRSGTGFWNYYFVVAFFKTPLSILVLLILATALIFYEGRRLPHFWVILMLGFSIFYFIFYFSFFNNSQVGIRHILMIYPLLYVLLGVLTHLRIKNGWTKAGGGTLLLYSIFTFYRFYPNLISYHNEMVRDIHVYRIMGDSNIDFGQSVFRYNAYRRKHPDLKVPGPTAKPGRYIVSPDIYTGANDKYDIRWLSDHFKPDAVFDHCYLIFDIAEKDLEQKGIN